MNGASNVGWNESEPAGNELVGSAHTVLHSLKTAIRTGMDDEHNWPSASGNGFGYHRFGATRAYYGTRSQLSSDGTDSRLMVTSDTTALYGMSALAAFFLGNPNSISMVSSADSGFPQKSHWVMDSGVEAMDGGTALSTATFQGSGYSGIPTVIVGPLAVGLGIPSFGVLVSVTTRRAVMTTSDATGAVAGVSVYWMSIGTRAI